MMLSEMSSQAKLISCDLIKQLEILFLQKYLKTLVLNFSLAMI